MNENEKIREVFLTLPPEEQYALVWVVQHIEIVHFLAQGEAIPKNMIEKMIIEALEKKEYIDAVLLTYKAIYDSLNS